MIMAEIMIAGLPSAGKSTYIGALAYTLKKPVANQVYNLLEQPSDISIIKRLYDPWLSAKIVDRTALGNASSITLSIQKNGHSSVKLSMPDVAGEEFEHLLQNQSDILKTCSDFSDGLLFLIKDIPTEVLSESFYGANSIPNVSPSTFDSKKISLQVKNLLLVKELYKQFGFKKIAIGLSAWDCQAESSVPEEFLKQSFPVFYNYIHYIYPNAFIFGLSAQGAEYNKDNIEEIEKRTTNGTRAYIVRAKDKEYDLTIPIDYLIC
jgi:hypothetical protein